MRFAVFVTQAASELLRAFHCCPGYFDGEFPVCGGDRQCALLGHGYSDLASGGKKIFVPGSELAEVVDAVDAGDFQVIAGVAVNRGAERGQVVARLD